MKINKGDAFLAGITVVGTVTFLTLLTIFVAGCEHGSLIPIDPITDEPVDVCAVEGVEECCPEPTVCPPTITCETCADPEAVIRALIENYERGFADGAASVACPPTGWTCADFADRPPGHRPIECRKTKGAGRR